MPGIARLCFSRVPDDAGGVRSDRSVELVPAIEEPLKPVDPPESSNPIKIVII